MAKKIADPLAGVDAPKRTTDAEVQAVIDGMRRGNPPADELPELAESFDQKLDTQEQGFPAVSMEEDTIDDDEGDFLIDTEEEELDLDQDASDTPKFHPQDIIKKADGTTNWEATAKKTLKRNRDMRKGVQEELLPYQNELEQQIANIAKDPVKEELPPIPFSQQQVPQQGVPGYDTTNPALANLASFIQQTVSAGFDNKFKTMRASDQDMEIRKASADFSKNHIATMQAGGDFKGDLAYIESIKQTAMREPDGTLSWFNPKTGQRTPNYKQLLEDTIDIRYKTRNQEVSQQAGYQKAMKQVLQNNSAAAGTSTGNAAPPKANATVALKKSDYRAAKKFGMSAQEWAFWKTASPEQIERYKQKKGQ